ncbi:MAG: dephospho-CoA kinase [Alphaproteobacteria bacterium]|jgi:dephospho-CoA kinase|nr:dephospho-CoA kinase [Alphaproteobacteria bacterium]
MVIVGLTGSIGMGKSTAAALLRTRGVPVHESDAAVHRLFAPGGAAVRPIGAAFPDIIRDGAVDRAALGSRVFGDAEALARLEAIVHPLVRADMTVFLARRARLGYRVVVLDVPLLLEAGWWARCDLVAVVSAPYLVQRQRVLARPAMSEARLQQILTRQMPDAEKRRRADVVIPSGLGKARTLRTLDALLARARRTPPRHWPPNPFPETRDARNRSGH